MKNLILLPTIALLIFALPLQSQSSKRVKKFAEKIITKTFYIFLTTILILRIGYAIYHIA